VTDEQKWKICKSMRELRAEQRGEVVEFFEPVQIIYPKPIQPDTAKMGWSCNNR